MGENDVEFLKDSGRDREASLGKRILQDTHLIKGQYLK